MQVGQGHQPCQCEGNNVQDASGGAKVSLRAKMPDKNTGKQNSNPMGNNNRDTNSKNGGNNEQ